MTGEAESRIKGDCCFGTRQCGCGDECLLQLGVNCCIGGKLRCVVFTEQTGSVVVKEAEDRTRGSGCDGGGGT